MQDTSTRQIPLTKGKVAIVSSEDYERVRAHGWTARPNRNGKWYAVATIKQEKVALHRFVLNAPKGIEVDHKSGDGLDCRRTNLRLATRCQNNQNHPRRRTNTSGFKGVSYAPSSSTAKPWRVRIEANRKRMCVGYFASAEEAARAYDARATELFGEFARLNFPKG